LVLVFGADLYVEDANVLSGKVVPGPEEVNLMGSELLQRLEDRSMTKEDLLQKVKKNADILPDVLVGVSSSKPAIRYGCAKLLMDLSEERPEKLYPHMDFFIGLLNSKYRIITWNAIAVIANLARIDKEKKFDSIFDRYYSFLNDAYMVTVANIVSHSGKIALAKPYLIPRITKELLKVENLSTNPHLTEECKRVIAEKTIKFFGLFFDKVEDKEKVISFVARHAHSSRKTLKKEAEEFLTKFG